MEMNCFLAFFDCTIEASEAIVRLRGHCALENEPLLFHWLQKLEGDESSKIRLGNDLMESWVGKDRWRSG